MLTTQQVVNEMVSALNSSLTEFILDFHIESISIRREEHIYASGHAYVFCFKSPIIDKGTLEKCNQKLKQIFGTELHLEQQSPSCVCRMMIFLNLDQIYNCLRSYNTLHSRSVKSTEKKQVRFK